MKMFLCKFLLALGCASGYNIVAVPSNPRSYIPPTFKTPANFGKTNFIVGFPHRTAVSEQRLTLGTNAGSVCNQAYFSPDDNLQQKLIERINAEKSGIHMAIFSFTDKKIAEALYDAHKRNVLVEIIADSSCHTDKFSKIAYLKDVGIPVFIYDPKKSATRSNTLSNIMHNKFVIFDCNKDDASLVWTGSFNFTRSADKSNQENVIVTNDPTVITKFKEQFAILKTRAHPATAGHA